MPPRYLHTPADVDAAIQLGLTTEGIDLEFKATINGFAATDSQPPRDCGTRNSSRGGRAIQGKEHRACTCAQRSLTSLLAAFHDGGLERVSCRGRQTTSRMTLAAAGAGA
jgi:hypothetical protein